MDHPIDGISHGLKRKSINKNALIATKDFVVSSYDNTGLRLIPLAKQNKKRVVRDVPAESMEFSFFLEYLDPKTLAALAVTSSKAYFAMNFGCVAFFKDECEKKNWIETIRVRREQDWKCRNFKVLNKKKNNKRGFNIGEGSYFKSFQTRSLLGECVECGMTTSSIHLISRESLCHKCCSSNAKYELVNESSAMRESLLSKSRVKALPHMYIWHATQGNNNSNAIVVYCRRDVKELAMQVHGSENHLRKKIDAKNIELFDKHKQQRKKAKLLIVGKSKSCSNDASNL